VAELEDAHLLGHAHFLVALQLLFGREIQFELKHFFTTGSGCKHLKTAIVESAGLFCRH
jgi:hypothetical protein